MPPRCPSLHTTPNAQATLKVPTHGLSPNLSNCKGDFPETMFLQFVGEIKKNLLSRSSGNFKWIIYKDYSKYPRSGFLKSRFFTPHNITKKCMKTINFREKDRHFINFRNFDKILGGYLDLSTTNKEICFFRVLDDWFKRNLAYIFIITFWAGHLQRPE